MKTKKTKAAYLKRARRGMLGLSLNWCDSEPFQNNGELGEWNVSHSNPTQKIICKSMWTRYKQWIVTTEFTWRVILRVVFTGAEKGDCYADAEHIFTCSLMGPKSEKLNESMMKSFNEFIAGNNSYQDGHKNKGTYSHSEFLAEIIGV